MLRRKKKPTEDDRSDKKKNLERDRLEKAEEAYLERLANSIRDGNAYVSRPKSPPPSPPPPSTSSGSQPAPPRMTPLPVRTTPNPARRDPPSSPAFEGLDHVAPEVLQRTLKPSVPAFQSPQPPPPPSSSHSAPRPATPTPQGYQPPQPWFGPPVGAPSPQSYSAPPPPPPSSHTYQAPPPQGYQTPPPQSYQTPPAQTYPVPPQGYQTPPPVYQTPPQGYPQPPMQGYSPAPMAPPPPPPEPPSSSPPAPQPPPPQATDAPLGTFPKGTILQLEDGTIAIYKDPVKGKEYEIVYALRSNGKLRPEGIALYAYEAKKLGRIPEDIFEDIQKTLRWDRDAICFHLEKYEYCSLIPMSERPPSTDSAPAASGQDPKAKVVMPDPPTSPLLDPARELVKGRRIYISFGPGKTWESVYWGKDLLGHVVAHHTNNEWALMHLDIKRFRESTEIGEILRDEEIKAIQQAIVSTQDRTGA